MKMYIFELKIFYICFCFVLKEAFDRAINTHSVLLADMRIPDTGFILDPGAIEKNPIVIKRKKAQQEG